MSSSSTNESSDGPAPAVANGSSPGKRRRRRSGSSRTAGLVTSLGAWLCVAAVGGAPLAVGGVHRISLVVLMTTAAVGLLAFAWGSATEGRELRVGLPVLLPLTFVLIPLLQSIPIPSAVRALLDPKGSALLGEGLIGPEAVAPLSLDPPSSRADIGKAAAALAIFIVAYHVASGQRRRHLFLRAIGAVGIAAVLIGIGHRVFGVVKIYGLITSTMRTLVIGPFVNSNHTAELLELSAFVCLACAFLRPTALSRIGWLAGMVLCLGGAAATLSRGAVLAVGMGALLFVFVRYLAKDENAPARRPRVTLAWGALVLGLVTLGAAALGAGQLVDRFQAGSVTSDIRFKLWRDSLHVLAAHPFGIGRGAFERVFPIYRTIKTSFPLRFAFVENQPLQLLIDSGWFFFAILVAATGLVVSPIVRYGRRDKIEAALLAALFAIGVQNLFDFGLETPGILLPFMAVLGTLLGRLRPADVPTRPRLTGAVMVAACVGLVVGVASVAHASYDDFDARLKTTRTTEARRALLERAQRSHPTDYIYALAYARLQPIRAPQAGTSPRLHALNRALALCSGCETVHAEVAHNLWKLGLRPQALLEWRSAVQIQPQILNTAFAELFASGAKPQELASVAASDPTLMVEMAHLLDRVGHPADALVVLDQSEALGGPRDEIWMLRAHLLLQMGRTVDAAVTLARADAAGIHDPRLAVLEVQQLIATQGAASVDRALALLDEAATRYPSDLGVQRARVELVMTFGRWRAADRALEGLKEALYHNQLPVSEAHIAAARIYTRLSRWNDVINEYRMAMSDAPGDVALWMEFGGAATTAGRDLTAREAYAQAARLSPKDPAITKALHDLDDRAGRLREPGMR